MDFSRVQRQQCFGGTRLYVYTEGGGSRFLRGVDPLLLAYTASRVTSQRSQKLPFSII
jgi:hypothetical protein